MFSSLAAIKNEHTSIIANAFPITKEKGAISKSSHIYAIKHERLFIDPFKNKPVSYLQNHVK